MVEGKGRRAIVPVTELPPIVCGLDNRYYSVGEMIGVGYAEGKKYQRMDAE